MIYPKRILVTRTDKLGDFMLTWPALALLRQAVPEVHIDVLVAEAVEEMASACPYVDGVVVDRGGTLMRIAGQIRENRYDAALAFFVTGRVSAMLLAAGVPYRLAPATKLPQILFNHRLVQRRSRSAQPEHSYNSDLVRRLLSDHDIPCPCTPEPPYLWFDKGRLYSIRQGLSDRYGMPAESRLVVVHPGSGGSANNLSPGQYAMLGDRLACDDSLFILVTAGPGEKPRAERVAEAIGVHAAAVHESAEGLIAFAQVLAVADVFISGSTGPLHIAGALDVPTAAFYPRRRSSTALRWQTTNQPDRRLAFSPPENANETDMAEVDVAAAAKMISEAFLDA